MSSVPLPLAQAEIDAPDGARYCSYCSEQVPQHLQGEQPCPLCHEFSFLTELAGTDDLGRPKFRMARNSTQDGNERPLIAGMTRRCEFKRK
jgi:hypothetical protein